MESGVLLRFIVLSFAVTPFFPPFPVTGNAEADAFRKGNDGPPLRWEYTSTKIITLTGMFVNKGRECKMAGRECSLPAMNAWEMFDFVDILAYTRSIYLPEVKFDILLRNPI